MHPFKPAAIQSVPCLCAVSCICCARCWGCHGDIVRKSLPCEEFNKRASISEYHGQRSWPSKSTCLLKTFSHWLSYLLSFLCLLSVLTRVMLKKIWYILYQYTCNIFVERVKTDVRQRLADDDSRNLWFNSVFICCLYKVDIGIS